MLKLSERIANAYMVGDKDAIESLNKESEDKIASLQRKTRITPIKANNTFNDDDVSAITVYEFLNDSFGDDWWEWEFETIERMLWVRFGVALNNINRDKVRGIKHLCNSNRPFKDWHEFNNIGLSVSGVIADFESLRKPTPGMIINTVKVMQYIRPEELYSFEVKKYICLLLFSEGIYTPPPSLAMLIKDEFSEVVSKESTSKWSSVFNRMKELFDNKDDVLEENVIDIQTGRLMHAEKAALAYAK